MRDSTGGGGGGLQLHQQFHIGPPGGGGGEGGGASGAVAAGGAAGAVALAPDGSLIQDSLIDLNFSEQVKVNKNNYTLTFSGRPDGSLIASLVASTSSAAAAALKHGEWTEMCPFNISIQCSCYSWHECRAQKVRSTVNKRTKKVMSFLLFFISKLLLCCC